MTNLDGHTQIEPRPPAAGVETAAPISTRGRVDALAEYGRKLRGRPVGFLARRARRSMARTLRSAGSAVGYSSYALTGPAAARVARSGSFLLPWSSDSAADLRRAALPLARELEGVRRRADAAAAHRFDLLGSGERFLGERIDWARDFRSGLGWARKFHTRYTYTELLDVDRPSDVKVPWELNRLQFLPVLAEIALLTVEERYASAAIDLLWGWDRDNPVGVGIPWTSPMEAALRGISIIWTVELLHAGGWGARLPDGRVARLLAEHGRFLSRNVEFSDVNTNHHTACVLGLLYLGLAVDGLPEAARWRDRAVRSLRREIQAQTSPDGVCHEGSIPYHRLVTEMFVHARVIAAANGLDLGRAYDARLERMLDFVRIYTKPDGRAPQFGDNDDGRVLPLGDAALHDHRGLLAVGTALFGRGDMKRAAGEMGLDAFWLLGPEGRDAFSRVRDSSAAAERGSCARGGFFFLRNGEDYVAVDCGEVGWRGRGGHGHADTLSFEAVLGGVDLFTDTGSMTYSASREVRVRSISAAAHNVAVLDDVEPAVPNEHGIASVGAIPCRVLRVGGSASGIEFEGEHDGYARLDSPVTYRRSICLSRNESRLIVTDAFLGRGEHSVRWRFHLDPAWRVRLPEGTADPPLALLQHENGRALAFRIIPALPLRVEMTPLYPSYGRCVQRPCLTVEARMTVPFEARFEIGPPEAFGDRAGGVGG